ncbi:hypothetical protein FPOAC1_002412 [Fusarium poae]|uniref:hypothetical protein n=1 Tax=Fusarium poae TaxID=36050 RepID=UPI001CE91B7F|nr:hypothetical protein FPOAC1_002412 [Fusarium poae]KAG8676409.1 hypothetical protein FPOAC1_002412 [Fusarium poae]
MDALSETVTSYRIACIFSQSYPNRHSVPEACRTGEVDWRHFREHMRKKHVCKCGNNCKTPMHFSAKRIDDILKLRKKDGDPYDMVWTEMYRLAHPGAVHVPAPFIPTFNQALAAVRNPTEGFMKRLVLDFASQGGTSQQEATKNLSILYKYLPVFYNTLSRTGPEATIHTVAQADSLENLSSNSPFTDEEGPLQLPTPAADSVPTHASTPGWEGPSMDHWTIGEMAREEQEHMDFLEKE